MTRTLEFANRPGNQPAAEPRLHAANGLVIDRPRAWTMILNQSNWRSLAATYMVNLLVIVGAVTIGLNHESRPQALFDEGRAVTWLSAAQILAVGIASLAMFLKRRSTLVAGASGARSRWIWLLMAGGLALLAADEAFALHERADLAIHSALGWRENALTDRLDDIIILACGLAGVCTL